MSSAPTPQEIRRDARWLAQALDSTAGRVRLIAMDRDSYRAASFLDDRMLQQPVDAQIVPWPDVETAIDDDMRSDARWIFHIGHVGSTLVSRLLGELPNVLAIREPRLLRDVALSPPEIRERYVAPVARLMSRTFADDERACVKATSFVSEVAPLSRAARRARAFHVRDAAKLYRQHSRRREFGEGSANDGGEPRRTARRARFRQWGRRTAMPSSRPLPGRAR